MTRRVHQDREPEAPPVQTDGREESAPDPRRPMRVAGVVRECDVNEVQRIAGALEVATWIQRVSFIARPRGDPTHRSKELREHPRDP